jgi:DNA-binding transcriptional ArsR family regulator
MSVTRGDASVQEPDLCQIHQIDERMVHKARAQLVDDRSAAQLSEFFRALGDATRVRIVSALSVGELCVCDLAAALDMSQSAISHQLRILRQLHLVHRRKAGQMMYYTLDDAHVSTLFREGMDHVGHST